MTALLLLLTLGAPLFAQRAIVTPPPPFVPSVLAAVLASLERQPLYGSMLVNAFDLQLRVTAPMDERRAAEHLKAEILGTGRNAVPTPKFVAGLGRSPIGEQQAAALLLANAVARPDQFRDVLDGLEGLRPGLGKALQARLSMGGDARGRFSHRLHRLGESLRPAAPGSTYDRRGELDALFDRSGDYPAY